MPPPNVGSARQTEPSMKVPPKRKGNLVHKVPEARRHQPSMKVPPKRKGNRTPEEHAQQILDRPSMKVPPKRKGNTRSACSTKHYSALNESPSEKEGK